MYPCGRNVCQFCEGQTLYYWDLMHDEWQRQLTDFAVGWDPDYVF